MSKTNNIEETLIAALKKGVMSFSDMTTLLKLEYNLQSAKLLAELLEDIKQKEHLIEKLPGQFYI